MFAMCLVLVAGQGTTALAQEALRPDPGPGVRPVPGPVVLPFDPGEHRYAPGHRGVDLQATEGALVRAARAGIVTWAGAVAGTRYVTIDHGGGLDTTYADLVPVVVAGASVRAGEVIGTLAPGSDHLDWGARWDHGGVRSYFDPQTLLIELRPVLVPSRGGDAASSQV